MPTSFQIKTVQVERKLPRKARSQLDTKSKILNTQSPLHTTTIFITSKEKCMKLQLQVKQHRQNGKQ